MAGGDEVVVGPDASATGASRLSPVAAARGLAASTLSSVSMSQRPSGPWTMPSSCTSWLRSRPSGAKSSVARTVSASSAEASTTCTDEIVDQNAW